MFPSIFKMFPGTACGAGRFSQVWLAHSLKTQVLLLKIALSVKNAFAF